MEHEIETGATSPGFPPGPGWPGQPAVPGGGAARGGESAALAPLAESRLTPRIAFATWSSKWSGLPENPRTSKLSDAPDALRPESLLLHATLSKAIEVDRGRY